MLLVATSEVKVQQEKSLWGVRRFGRQGPCAFKFYIVLVPRGVLFTFTNLAKELFIYGTVGPDFENWNEKPLLTYCFRNISGYIVVMIKPSALL